MSSAQTGAYSRLIGLPDIEASGGTVRTLDYYLRLGLSQSAITEEEMRRLEKIEIRAHAAAFYIGNSDLSVKESQAAYAPYYRENITYKHCLRNSVRAVAAAAISSAIAEIWVAAEDRVADVTNE